jgi:hypothetical protein
MSELWVVGFKAALLRYVQAHGHPEATEVTSWGDSASDVSGGCDTCYSGPDYEVDIFFLTPGRTYPLYYTYNGHFTDLLHELTGD